MLFKLIASFFSIRLILFFAPKIKQISLLDSVPMKLDNPLLTLNEILQLLLKPKSKHSLESGSLVASACGLVIDASNYLAKAQKITLIDHTNQQMALDVLLQGSQQKDFAVELEIGDILYVEDFIFLMHGGRLTAYQAGEHSKIAVIAGYREDSRPQEIKDNLDFYPGLTAREVQVRILRKFGYKYFQTKQVPVKSICKADINPEQTIQQNRMFDIIAKVISCEEIDHKFRVTMTDQRNNFFIEFSRAIKIGLYKVRGIPSMKVGQDSIELSADFSTNFLKISPWMRSFNLVSANQIINTSNQPRITTRLLTNSSQLPTMTLKQLLNQTQHLSEVIVNCEILDIDTSFGQAFKKLTISTQDHRNRYSELHYKENRGILITKVHLVITDPSMEGQTMNVYLYPYDGRGREFMPGLDPFEIRERIGKEENYIELKYFEFVNNVLEQTSFEANPLKMILSPMRRYKRSTVYRIVDTELIMNC